MPFISLTKLVLQMAVRPKGYLFDVLSLAEKVTKDYVFFDKDTYQRLCAKYGSAGNSFDEEISKIGKICEECEEKYDCDFTALSACKRKKLIRDGEAKCPLNKWNIKDKKMANIRWTGEEDANYDVSAVDDPLIAYGTASEKHGYVSAMLREMEIK